jgi:hypothetical protein
MEVIEKRKALPIIEVLPGKNEKSRIIAIEAPKLAAEETPKVKGDARLLFRTICISTPAIAKEAPANMASIILGKRIKNITRNSLWESKSFLERQERKSCMEIFSPTEKSEKITDPSINRIEVDR